MKFTQTAVIETELPPEADVADFVNGDGDTEPLQDIFDEALQLTKEAVDIAIENREAEADSPSLDVDSEIDNVLKQEEQDRRISSLVCEVVPAPDGSTTDPPLPPLPPIEDPDDDIDAEIQAYDLVTAAHHDPEFAEIFNNWLDAREKWEDQCTKIRWSHRLKLDDLKSEIIILSKKIEDLRQLTKEAKAEYKQCLSDLMDGEKKGPELPKKPECITYERFLELKEQASKSGDGEGGEVKPLALYQPNQDEEWKSVPTSRIFEGKTIKGLGPKKIEAVCDVAPTIGELEELRNQASLKHLHFCKMLPKGIGEELADAIQDLMYPHTYPNSKGNA